MNKRKKGKNRKKNLEDALIIDASGKREIEIIYVEDWQPDVRLSGLKNEFAQIEENIKNTYYSNNATVKRVENRSFLDLLKILKIR